MARCVDCYWFNNKHPAGRNATSCEQLGERPSNSACDQFLNKDAAPTIPSLPVIQEADYKQSYRDILSEAFNMLRDGDYAVKEIFTLLRQQGVDVDMDSTSFQRHIDKLSDIYVLHRLCLALGLAPYTEQIVSQEIYKRFPSSYKDQDK